MPFANEVDCKSSVFICPDPECEGVMEANAMGWLTLEKGSDGKPTLSVYGFSEADYAVTCSECGSDGDAELEQAVGQIIYGDGTTEWFRG